MKKTLKGFIKGQSYKSLPYDPFIARLPSSVIGEGMLHKGNIYLMDLALREMPDDGAILEIGSYGGLSTNLILYLLKKHDRKQNIFTCDPWIYEGYEDHKGFDSESMDGRNDIGRTEYMEYIQESFKNALQLLNRDNLPHSFRMTSDDFFMAWNEGLSKTDLFGNEIAFGGKFSFAYIDGNHAYDFAKRDFENVDKHLLNGGYILFDDSADGAPFGSAKLMSEVKSNSKYELVERNPNYLFRKKR